MSGNFDRLLARMPEVASVVNSFKSEAVQQLAFDALVRSFGGAYPADQPNASSDVDGEDEGKSTRISRKSKRAKAGTAKRETVEPVKGLDLRPQGKASFTDFVADKQPKSNQDKFVVAVYWLEQVAGINPITIAHIAAIFKQTEGWRESGNLRVGLTSTAARKNTLDTSDLNNIRTTPHGRNFVQHDLPKTEKKRK